MIYKNEDCVTLSQIKPGQKFMLCRTSLKYRLEHHGAEKCRSLVKPVNHTVGVYDCHGGVMRIPHTLNSNCKVLPL